MRIAVDTNVLIRSINAADPLCPALKARAAALIAGGHELCIAQQCIFEFWAVATKPAKANGLGLTIDDAQRAVGRMLLNFPLIPDPPDIISRWLYLCCRYRVTGRRTHDARLAAWVLGNGLDRLWTLDVTDFSDFQEVALLEDGARR